MVVVPAVKPLTIPLVPIVATAVLLLLHTPPVVVSISVVVPPAHKLRGPPIEPTIGSGLTVTIAVT